MTPTQLEELHARAARWADEDPDPASAAELRALLGKGDAASELELVDRFAQSLEFGTAGLRGILGAGPNRMNRAVVLRTTYGLAQHLVASVAGARDRGVVIGYDGRRLSREFAEDTAAVLAAEGIRAWLFTEPVPTPLAAFAVHELSCAAGVMVTASHNPPEYNGYKAYWTNAAQIIPPTDVAIAEAIDRAPAASKVPRLSLDEAKAKGLLFDVLPAVEEKYLARVRAAVSLGARADADRSLVIVYTPMHGVGDKLARLAFDQAGFKNVLSVPEQQKPDGRFPTVAFPNPEEPGAMDLAFALAKKQKAALVLANDPDADRLAVALPVGDSFVQLTGNDVGALLGHHLLKATSGAEYKGRRLVIASLVSSPLLGFMAKALGVRYEETLTGFKWIANRAMELEREGYTFVFGYEEALGYTVGDVVRDKDGVSAAVLVAEIAAGLRAEKKTILDALESIAREYGLFVSSQVNVTRKGVEGAAEIRAMMERLRANKPASIGASRVVAVKDYSTGELPLPKSNVLAFDLEGGSRVIARPSGTEPKVKFYFDVREEVRQGEPIADAKARAVAKGAALAAAFTSIAATTTSAPVP